MLEKNGKEASKVDVYHSNNIISLSHWTL